ncbi:hypothetical protein [Pectobacterium parmentieri]|uniref:hypothetical protein n=1 Tax=Pectobacterium parmentieri TaxID=1905730 RepID=UPI000CDE4D7E|nr:hypothetical protein [Pectobacterium parmentieri]AYH07703.1 hypothetical protein C5E25_21295 [Pectobacterium parmentieri]AYH16455.1 hypothetical protein C5E23_20895 [Pectobacterium parmentieri]AYH25156.1 hypothetical protein C5E21_20925 [Pectobacterium parmentieri]MBN3177280.1 hypothetical protein [Pectobacterium parmentieri]POW23726.1 Immunity protein RhsIC [Pectobacterium parmentieri]
MTSQTLSNENNELLKIASESFLKGWTFSEQRLTVDLITSDDDELTVYIETDLIQSSPIYLNEDLNICRLSIQDMHKILAIQHGYYVPPSKFSDLMKYSSECYSFFYGKKSDFKYLASFVGYEKYIACPIKFLEDVSWSIK